MNRNLRKERIGVVTSNKMDKSIVVSIARRVKHDLYGKFLNKTSKFIAHDEKNECNEGDTVKIMETRPMSKSKNWRFSARARRRARPGPWPPSRRRPRAIGDASTAREASASRAFAGGGRAMDAVTSFFHGVRDVYNT